MAEEHNNSNNNAEAAAGQQQAETNFEIRKIYLKDASCESPNAPAIFLSNPKAPDVSIDASIKAAKLDQDDYFEVVLGITVTSKVEEQTAFLVEVQQAGVFHIVGVPANDMPMVLQIACPNVLLPFAREAVSDLVTKAGFPQLLLTPINFEALYQQKLAQSQAAETGSSSASSSASESPTTAN